MSINNREKKRIRTETEFSRNYFLSSKKEKRKLKLITANCKKHKKKTRNQIKRIKPKNLIKIKYAFLISPAGGNMLIEIPPFTKCSSIRKMLEICKWRMTVGNVQLHRQVGKKR